MLLFESKNLPILSWKHLDHGRVYGVFLALSTQDSGLETVPLMILNLYLTTFSGSKILSNPFDARGKISYESLVICTIYQLVVGPAPNHRDKWIGVPRERAYRLGLLLALDGRILVEHLGKELAVTYSDEQVAVQFGAKPFDQEHPDEHAHPNDEYSMVVIVSSALETRGQKRVCEIMPTTCIFAPARTG